MLGLKVLIMMSLTAQSPAAPLSIAACYVVWSLVLATMVSDDAASQKRAAEQQKGLGGASGRVVDHASNLFRRRY